jgi:transcriptional regulator with XRE-family HTH domain
MSDTPAARARSVGSQPRKFMSSCNLATSYRCRIPISEIDNRPDVSELSTQFLTAFHNGNVDGLKLTAVKAQRGRRAPRFGKYLKQLREQRLGKRSSFAQVVEQLSDKGFEKIAASTIWRYEDGRQPDLAVLAALADLYRADYFDLVNRLAEEISKKASRFERKDESVRSVRALELAAWFDQQSETKQESVLSVLGIAAPAPRDKKKKTIGLEA